MENQLKPQPETSTPEPPVAGERKGLKFGKADKLIRLALFLAAIGMVYIWNAHRAEGNVRRMISLENEVRELKTDYSILSSELSFATRQSVLQEKIDTPLGLKKMDNPPFTLE